MTAALLLGTLPLLAPTPASAAACVSLSTSTFEVDTDANLKLDNPLCVDWLNAAGTAYTTGVNAQADKPTGTGDDSFGQGTSENDAVPKIVTGSIPPNKSDLKSFGEYQQTAAGKTYLALYWSRVQNPSGTTNMDFEINQNRCITGDTTSVCSSNGVTPVRKAGDLLITYDLSKGGTVPTIAFRRWLATGVWGAATTLGGTQALGSVNTTTISAANGGPLGTQDPYTFGEAVVDLNAVLGGATCGAFGSVYLKSRSSDSFTSEIKDYIAPEPVSISNCSAITTSATASVVVGGTLTDQALLTGVGASAGGTVTYSLYDNNTCTGTAVFTSTKTVTNGVVPASAAYTTTSVGTYYWVATYSGDGSNVPATGKCLDTGETSTVTKASPAIATSATTSVAVGGTVQDTATLTGATANAGGTVTYSLYSSADCPGTPVYTQTVTVSGGLVPGTTAYTPASAGTYKWVATYSGDANNNGATGACGDAGETSTVTPRTPTIATSATSPVTVGASIKDTATLSGATANAGGTVTYSLFATSTCTAPALFTSTVTVAGGIVPDSGSFTPTAVGTYSWIASYSGDTNNSAASGACGDTGESSVVGKAASTVATAQFFYPQDTATLSATAAGTPTGDVTFSLFSGTACGGTALYSGSGTLASGVASSSNGTAKVTADGSYSWKVEYAGDASHNAVSSCVENTTVAVVNGAAVPGS